MPEHNNEHTDLSIPGGAGGFETPEGYFEALSLALIRKTAGNGFRVPAGYFDTLAGRIAGQVKPAPAKKLIIFTPAARRTLIGLAAAAAIVCGFFFFRQGPQPTQNTGTAMDKVSDEEIINYVDVSDLSDQKLMEFASNTEDKAVKQTEEAYILGSTDDMLIPEDL